MDAEARMIRPLRRAHRRLIFLLVILLPIVLALALVRREEPPVQRDWPFPPSPQRGYGATTEER
jgi:hypothetical protein